MENEMLETTNESENIATQATEEIEGVIEEVSQEEQPTITQSQLNQILKDRLARQERRLTEKHEEKLSRLENVLNAGLGTKNLEDATNKLSEFYKEKGIEIPEHKLSAREEEILANNEAEEVIKDGYDEISNQINHYEEIGLDNMSERDKKIFVKLVDEKNKQDSIRDLKAIGVNEDLINDKEFKNFADKLNPKMTLKEKYEMYEQFKPKPKIETMGSMKGTPSNDNGVKDFYTKDEAMKFTREDFDKNPELFKAVEKSMLKW